MLFLRRRSFTFDLCRRHHDHRHHIRTLFDGVSALQFPADRGLDHAVEREQHVKPVVNLKNFIISEPSKSVPLNLITQSKENLEIPFRPVDFIRKYPSIFQEYHPGSLNIHPHINLTPEVISLNSEENLLFQSVDYKQDVANRLLKLLMICRVNKIPIVLLERLKWELGLPQDYEKSVIPEFPDYFRLNNENTLELVCWTDELAVSEIEKKGCKDGNFQFILDYSKGFEMDKKYKKWVDEWQKLPYVSPYENAIHLAAKTDESDKWAVAVLHEVLNLFVGKKADRENLFCLGECLGLRSRFKLALLQHPGIFYVSSKIRMHTVVLRDGYKRGMLIERHPLMHMRFKYAHLMNVVKDVDKSKAKESTLIEGKKGEETKDVERDLSDNDENDNHSDDNAESENGNRRGRFRGRNLDFKENGSRRSYNHSDDNAESENGNRRGRSRGRNADFKENGSRRSGNHSDDNAESENGNRRGRFRGRNSDFKENGLRRSYNHSDDNDESENGNRRGRFRGRNSDFKENGSRRSYNHSDDNAESENGNRRGRFRGRNADFIENGSRRNVRRSKDVESDTRREEGDKKRNYESENVNRRGGFRGKYPDFKEKGSIRSVETRRNVRRSKDMEGDTRRMYGSSDNDGRNVDIRGRFGRKKADFEENAKWRRNGRFTEKNGYESSTRFSGRTNTRGGRDRIVLSRDRIRLKTEKNSM